ncbi:MAG: hypothetical protein LBR85_07145 [Oscillospiraceae bacterium]|jgi:hypothetical protein|nr:hypothetical protein [Oscillospiraceae bacterium]
MRRVFSVFLVIALLVPSASVLAAPDRAGRVEDLPTLEEVALRVVELEYSDIHTLTYRGKDPSERAASSDESLLMTYIGAGSSKNITYIEYEYIPGSGVYTLSWEFEGDGQSGDMYAAAADIAREAVAALIPPEGMGLRDKYKVLHDWLAGQCAYGYADEDVYGQFAWNALVEGLAVCNGYAKAYMLLCETAGLPCIFVSGEARSGGRTEAHAWNMVPVDGHWLYIDVTWDDRDSGAADYDYFLVTHQEISKDHKFALDYLKIATVFCPERFDMADYLAARGMFAGTGAGYELAREPSRAEGSTVFIRLVGIADTYDPATCPMPFSDVPSWAIPFVALMFKHGYTAGTGDGSTFGSETPLTLDMYATFLLIALGYDSGTDFRWDSAGNTLVSLGILDGDEAEAILIRGFKRGDIVLLSYRGLMQMMKDSAVTLEEFLAA